MWPSVRSVFHQPGNLVHLLEEEQRVYFVHPLVNLPAVLRQILPHENQRSGEQTFTPNILKSWLFHLGEEVSSLVGKSFFHLHKVPFSIPTTIPFYILQKSLVVSVELGQSSH